MNEFMFAWLNAFLVTQVVEIPIYLYAGRKLPVGRRWLLAVGASTVTHPFVWFAFPWFTAPYVPTIVAAECFAVLTEAGLAYLAGVKSPLKWSFLANAGSVIVGVTLRWLINWP
jgi:hypothetical protein